MTLRFRDRKPDFIYWAVANFIQAAFTHELQIFIGVMGLHDGATAVVAVARLAFSCLRAANRLCGWPIAITSLLIRITSKMTLSDFNDFMFF